VDYLLGVIRKESAQAGQGLPEYALILTLVTVLIIGALTLLGSGIESILSTVAGAL
jgi:Flp pilus assembly pilin Flp